MSGKIEENNHLNEVEKIIQTRGKNILQIGKKVGNKQDKINLN